MGVQVTSQYTDGTSSDAIQSFFNKMLLVRGVFEHHAQMLVKMNTLAQRQGKTMIWRRHEALSVATTPLVEGTTKSGATKTKADVSATLAAFGDYVENSDFLTLTQPEGVMDDIDLLGQQSGETFDKLYMNLWATATNTTFSNDDGTPTTAEVNTVMIYNDWVFITRALRNRKAKRFVPQIEASQKVGTLPIQPSYWAICTESQLFDLLTATTIGGATPSKLILAVEYGTGGSIRGEYGALKNGIRLLPVPDDNAEVSLGGGASGGSPAVQETSNDADVHSAFIIGREAGLGVNLAVANGGIIRKAMGSGGTSDPLDQRSTIGWKKYDARVMGNQDFIQEFQCAVSA